MADVFISYARTELDTAARIKAVLEKLGLSVYLDVDRLDGGVVFPSALDREVKGAGCVLALWSPHSLTRPWVLAECMVGKDREVLLPVEISPLKQIDVPIIFYSLQRLNLTSFADDPDHPGWRDVRRSLARILERPDLGMAAIERPLKAAESDRASGGVGKVRRRRFAPVALALGLLAVIAIGIVAWRVNSGAAPAPVSTSLAAFQKVDRSSAAALRAYISTYPDAPETANARLVLKGLDDSIWARVTTDNTIGAVDAYLAAFPEAAAPAGEHAEKAGAYRADHQALISRIQRALVARNLYKGLADGKLYKATADAASYYGQITGEEAPDLNQLAPDTLKSFAESLEAWNGKPKASFRGELQRFDGPSTCTEQPGSFIVYFEVDRDVLTPSATEVVEAAVESARRGGCALTLASVKDRGSIARATSVVEALVAAGVARQSIRIEPPDEEALAKVTRPGVREPLTRRVEITMTIGRPG